MNTSAQISPARTHSGPDRSTDPRRSSERPTFGEALAEIVPLVEYVPFYGPPVVVVLGPWLFLVLMLAGPFAFLVALGVAMIAAAAVVAALTAAILAILAAPYLLVRRLRRHRARHASIGAPAGQAVAPRVAT
jgi:hypothetical protein